MMTKFCKNIHNFIKKKLRGNKHGGGGVRKGHVIVYVGEEAKEYCVSSKCWDSMKLVRELHEQNLRCLPGISPVEFEVHLKHAKSVVKNKVKPYVPEIGLLD